MTRYLTLSLALAALPLAAAAMPVVGDVLGTDPAAATEALAAAGCTDPAFEAEDGMIEAKCTDASTGDTMEVYIDPATGAVVEIKSGD